MKRLTRWFKGSNRRKMSGQGMTEYVIIVGVIAVVLIGAFQGLSGVLNKGLSDASEKIGSGLGSQ